MRAAGCQQQNGNRNDDTHQQPLETPEPRRTIIGVPAGAENPRRGAISREPAMPEAYWAYDFAAGHTLESMEAAFNAAGPWRWQLRDSAVYGDYLNVRPRDGVRVRIHEYPQMGCYGMF